jgi:hypothetical protein
LPKPLTLPPTQSLKHIQNAQAIYYIPEDIDLTRQFHLILYAGSNDSSGSITVGRPESLDKAIPLAMLAADGDQPYFLDCGLDKITFAIPSGGTTAQLLKVCEFSDLRGPGSDDPLWVCAPAATLVEDGEEEIDVPVKHQPHPTPQVAKHEIISVNDDDAPVTETTEATPELESSFDVPHDLPIEITEHKQPVVQQSQPVTGGFWLFRLLGRFLFGLYDIILASIRPRDGNLLEENDAPIHRQAVASEDGDEADEPEAMTPAEESSPLLAVSSHCLQPVSLLLTIT